MLISNNTNDYCLLVIKLIMLQKDWFNWKLFMVGSMLHCFTTFVYFHMLYYFCLFSHVSISLPYNTVQPMCRIFPGENAYEQTIWMIYGKWCICKFHWNCIFEVWIQKQSWNVFFLKEQHTELHAMWGDR